MTVENEGAHSGERGPLCGDCNPPPHGEPITQTVWLCPEHQAQQDAFMEKYGHAIVKRRPSAYEDYIGPALDALSVRTEGPDA